MPVHRDGFQPCSMESGPSSHGPRWEKRLVVIALSVHVIDVSLDLCVVLLFLANMQWMFLCLSAGVIVWAWLLSSLYVSFGGGGGAGGVNGSADIDGDPAPRGRLPSFLLNFVQVQIFTEAHRCLFRSADTDYFYTLRLMEAILESAPNALVQLYALVIWVGGDTDAAGAAALLRFSVFASFVSVGLGLAMWEQKVQFRASSGYIAAVAVMRAFEIASRSLTLAVFAGITHPYGFWWALMIDYCVMLALIVKHQSVQFSYGLFVALPLVLVSLEPLVWRWEDHAVPKDAYYLVRIVEFVLMWTFIIFKQNDLDPLFGSSPIWLHCEALALASTLGLYVILPFVWKVARKHELSRDVVDWGDDGSKEGLNQDEEYSDSDLSGSGDSSEGHVRGDGQGHNSDGELPPE